VCRDCTAAAAPAAAPAAAGLACMICSLVGVRAGLLIVAAQRDVCWFIARCLGEWLHSL
jgi:hypothetical protein